MKAGDEAAVRIAERQHGVVSREQAQRAGLSARQVRLRVANGRFVQLHPGVYRLAGAPRTWLGDLTALGLWLGSQAVISHRAAAELHGFSRFEGCGARDVTVARRVRAPVEVRVHRPTPLPPKERSRLRGLSVTSVERTLLDLAATEDARDARACVDEALRRRQTTVEKLEQFVARHGSAHGITLLRAWVDEVSGKGGPTESELEAKVLEALEDAGLPRPERQRAVYAAGRVRFLDFRFPGTRVVLEADGYAFHAGLSDFEKDRERHNALVLRGFVVLRWTWRALHDDPDRLTRELAALLEAPALRAA